MKNQIRTWMFLVLLALGSAVTNAQSALVIDSFTKTAFTIDGWTTANYAPDTMGQVSFDLLQNGTVVQQSPWVWVVQDSASHHQFTGLDTMNSYQIRANKFSAPSGGLILGVPQTVVTDTIVTQPTIIRDSIQKFVSQSMIRYWHHGGNGYDTAGVEVLIGTNQFFTGLTTSASAHLAFNVQSGYVQITNLPQNQTLYVKARKHNSVFTSAWTTVDTFGLWTGGSIVTYDVITGDSLLNYNNITLNGSGINTNSLRLRYGYTQIDVQNVGGYVVGITNSQTTTANVPVLPGTTLYYRAEAETNNGTIYGDIKAATSLAFPLITMPVTVTNADTSSAPFVFTPNTNGIYVDSFVVIVGQPTIATVIQTFTIGSAGVYNGAQQITGTVSGLASNSQYQIQIKAYAFTVLAASSNTATFTTDAVSTQPAAESFSAMLNNINVNLGNTGSGDDQVTFDFSFSSEHAEAMVWVDVSYDWDTTFINTIFNGDVEYVQSNGTTAYESSTIAADWSDYPGVYSARVAGFNSANNGVYYSNWRHFQVGVTGIVELTAQNSIVLNGQHLLVSEQDETTILIYNMSGQCIYTKKVFPNESISLEQPTGVYLYHTLNSTGEVGKGKIFLK